MKNKEMRMLIDVLKIENEQLNKENLKLMKENVELRRELQRYQECFADKRVGKIFFSLPKINKRGDKE